MTTFDMPRQRAYRPAVEPQTLGLVLPANLACHLCATALSSNICWDADAGNLACLRCATALHRLDRESGRFFGLTLDTRGKVAGMGWLPAGQAIACLVRYGARVI